MGQDRGSGEYVPCPACSLLPFAQPKIILIPALGQIGMIHKAPSGFHLHSVTMYKEVLKKD